MALVNRKSRFQTIATENPLDNSYQSALFAEKAGNLASFSGFQANNNGVVPGTIITPPPVPTTTTTTTTSTTTTTTTLPVGVYAFVMKYSTVSGADACLQTSTSTYYSNSATLDTFAGLATNVGLTNAAPNGYYCLAAGCPNSAGKQWIQVTSGGTISSSANC